MTAFRCPICGGPYPWRVWRSENGQWCRHGERFASNRDLDRDDPESVHNGGRRPS